MSDFVKVGTLRQFREGRGRAVTIDGVAIAVFRRAGGVVAVDDTCPHMGASLADGRLAGDAVECAWHRWKFDARSGKSDMRSWACVRVHEVRIDGEDVLIRRPEPPPPREEPPEEPWEPFDPERHLKKQ